MGRREFYIEGKCTEIAKRLGWRVRKMQFVGRRGCPDRWFFREPGRVVIVEFKDPNGKLSAHQKKEINWFLANGFEVHVIDSIDEFRDLFESFEATPEEAEV